MSATCEIDEPKIAGRIYATENRRVATPTFAWVILTCLGSVDLVRGVLHTFFVQHSAVHIAGMDLSHSGQDQLMLLGTFGISNFLTGAIYLAVALRARNLVPTVLAIIPAAYLVGFIGLRLNQISPESEFPGRIFMLVYCSVCAATWLASIVSMRSRQNDDA